MQEGNKINVEIKLQVKSKKWAEYQGKLFTADHEDNTFGYNSENQLINTHDRQSYLGYKDD